MVALDVALLVTAVVVPVAPPRPALVVPTALAVLPPALLALVLVEVALVLVEVVLVDVAPGFPVLLPSVLVLELAVPPLPLPLVALAVTWLPVVALPPVELELGAGSFDEQAPLANSTDTEPTGIRKKRIASR